ncbi:uncharacterized protein LOC135847725 [Planococcus citri]|uniref:uncharacterized protein LOC135847725 n=1 Tax=Planococcus citri TaxID=170843 RepID=UPI0031F9584D
MTEVPNLRVYDFAHPTPVSLQELSAIAVSLQIWRRRMEKYRQSGTLTTLRPKKERISLKTELPDLPSKIYKTIEAYFTQFGRSLEIWLNYHLFTVYVRYYEHKNLVLNDFDDFVCDYLGKIHYVRTAERIMRCDRIHVDEKFIIACICFFEDDIRRLWPSVCSRMQSDGDNREFQPKMERLNMHLKYIHFYSCPQLYYWVKCFNAHSGNITLASWLDKPNYLETEMFNEHRCSIRLSLEYFWDRQPLELKMHRAIELHDNDMVCFISVILPKLDDQQLDEFVKKRGRHLMCKLLDYDRFVEGVVLTIWFYIRNIMNEKSFAGMIAEMLEVNYNCPRKMKDNHEDDDEGDVADDDEEDSEDDDEDMAETNDEHNHNIESDDDFDEDSRMEDYDSIDEYEYPIEMSRDEDDDSYVSSFGANRWKGVIDLMESDRVNVYNCEPRKWDSYLHFCRKIWNYTPHNLKRSIIKGISVDSRLLGKSHATGNINSRQINIELLVLILQCASLEERMSFWQNCWPLLIAAARGDDLQRIAALCFENEHQINEFKQNIIGSSEHMRIFCFQLLRNGEYFDCLAELVSFVWPEVQNARNFKQQILRECFLNTRSKFEANIVLYHKKFNDFIADAFDSVDLSTEFKTQLILSSAIQNTLWRLIYRGRVSVQQVLEFMGTFVATEETLGLLKWNMIGIVKAYVNTNSLEREYLSNRPDIKSILLWCLGREEDFFDN